MGWNGKTGKQRSISKSAVLSWIMLSTPWSWSWRTHEEGTMKNHVEGTSELSTQDTKEGYIYPLVSIPPPGQGLISSHFQVHTGSRTAEQSPSGTPCHGAEKHRGRQQLSKVQSGSNCTQVVATAMAWAKRWMRGRETGIKDGEYRELPLCEEL